MGDRDEQFRKLTDDQNAFVPNDAPSFAQLAAWETEGGCMTVANCCWVEPDGTCEHGSQSWLLALGLI